MTAKVTKVCVGVSGPLTRPKNLRLTTPNACCGCLTMAVGSCPKKRLLNLAKKMGLDIKRIRKEITEPRKKATINKAVIHQNRIKFHAQTNVTPLMCLPTTDFLAWVQNLIPHDKFKIFKTLVPVTPFVPTR